MEVTVHMDNCGHRAREEVCLPAHTIYREDLSGIYAKVNGMVKIYQNTLIFFLKILHSLNRAS